MDIGVKHVPDTSQVQGRIILPSVVLHLGDNDISASDIRGQRIAALFAGDKDLPVAFARSPGNAWAKAFASEADVPAYLDQMRICVAGVYIAERCAEGGMLAGPLRNTALLEAYYLDAGAMRGIKFLTRQVDGITGRYRGDLRSSSAMTNQNQLPDEKARLGDGNTKKEHSEQCEPARIISDPLRFESDFLIDYRFLAGLAFLLVGLCFGLWSGKYLYDERYAIAAALVGRGWLCGFIGWGIAL
jgi:hypothetical protein